MTALTTRDALAKALHEFYCHYQGPQEFCSGPCELNADALIASGAVVDAATLVTPIFTAVVNTTQGDPTGHLPDCGYTDEHQACGCAEWGHRLHAAIAAALTERGGERG